MSCLDTGGGQFWYSHHVRRALHILLFTLSAALLAVSPRAQTPAAPQASTAEQLSPVVSPAPIVVVLDPAHGGADSGARGTSGITESDAVLDFARVMRVALEAQGFRVVLTRDGNQDPSFDDRSASANAIPDAVFVSLHVSSTGMFGTARAYSYRFADLTPGAADATPATQLFAPLPERRSGLVEWSLAQKSYLVRSQRLAELAQIQLAQKFPGSPDMPAQVPVRQLRTVAAPAIAVEVSSVSGAPDAKKLGQLGQPLADAVARAVVDYRASLRGAAGTGAER